VTNACFLGGKMKKMTSYFTRWEKALWVSSVAVICIFYVIFDGSGWMKLIASLVGVTSLIFLAKGNPFGNILMIVFSVLYAIISYGFLYYGEMITYMGMTAPMALFSLVSWLKNPYGKNKSQVKVRELTPKIFIVGAALTAGVTVAFYFILSAFNTANIVPSTISVLTSFFAAYLTFMRTPYFPLAYAFNDMVLIVMWAMATKENVSYVSVIVCFCVFLVNDLYGFVNWCRMRKLQKEGKSAV
jgi:nicotinamide mononucleotide transporter PnuC